MPLYMDRHDGLDATAKSLAEAHQLDLQPMEVVLEDPMK